MKQHGVEFYILDHKNEITKPKIDPHSSEEQKHGIWFMNKFYPSSIDGKISIPYGEVESKANGILIDNDFAQQHEI